MHQEKCDGEQELQLALAEVLKSEAIEEWLLTPSDAFDDLNPLEVIERGESDRIWAMIYYLRSGAPG